MLGLSMQNKLVQKFDKVFFGFSKIWAWPLPLIGAWTVHTGIRTRWLCEPQTQKTKFQERNFAFIFVCTICSVFKKKKFKKKNQKKIKRKNFQKKIFKKKFFQKKISKKIFKKKIKKKIFKKKIFSKKKFFKKKFQKKIYFLFQNFQNPFWISKIQNIIIMDHHECRSHHHPSSKDQSAEK